MSIKWCESLGLRNATATIYKNKGGVLLHLSNPALKLLGCDKDSNCVLFGYNKDENTIAIKLSDESQKGIRRMSACGNASFAGIINYFDLKDVFHKYPAEMKDSCLIINLNNPSY